MTKAQQYYLDKYQIDIAKLYSLPSLALKIYRAHFMPQDIKGIPTMKSYIDGFIRKGYIGGAVDIYKEHGEDMKHYDVNSLYPYAQSMEMPFECLGFRSQIESLDNFFGFLEVEVDCPLDMSKPMLPLREDNKTIFPVGKWKGIYFSEELKAMLPLGYKFKLLSGYEFSKMILFDKYVNHFFDKKKSAIGPERLIAKLLLNSLYGIFGRKLDNMTPLIIKNKDIPVLAATVKISTMMHISKTYTLVILDLNKPSTMLKDLNSQILTEINSFRLDVKSNVAIAAAITAYARIHMMPIKLLYDCYYSDTDSTYTLVDIGKVAPHFVGPELGQLKDELGGATIDEALFLGIKQYGYTYKDPEGKQIDKSVWAGVERDSITFDEIRSLAKAEVIQKESKPRFHRNISDLSLTIKPVKFKVNRALLPKGLHKGLKRLVNNQYLPPVVGIP